MPEFNDEINFTQYVLVLWKRKWLLIIPTALITILVGIYFLVSPTIWKINMIIQPSKFLAESAGGNFYKVNTINPSQLAGQIKESSYNQLLARQLNISLDDFPKFGAENLTNTDLVRVYVKMQETDKAKTILSALFEHLKFIYDKMINTEIQGIDSEISEKQNKIKEQELILQEMENKIKTHKSEIERTKDQILIKDQEILALEIEKDRIKKEIESFKNRLKISEERVMEISKEMTAVRERINETEEQLKIVLAEEKQENLSLSLLLYSNEIQQNLRYFNTLSANISNEKISQENIYVLILSNEKGIRQIDNQISQLKILKNSIKTEITDINTQIDMIRIQKEKTKSTIETIKSQITYLEEKKERYDYTQLIKNPTVLNRPASLGVKRGALLAGIISLLIFSVIAIFLENLKKLKIEPK
jgi:hypothetical protein